ncbi:MAG: hypothetical protein ACE5JI_01195, partial [Acidobacteriota bacterium]
MSPLRMTGRRWTILLLIAPWVALAEADDKIQVQPRIFSVYHSNFLQATDGAPKEKVWANVFEVRVIRKLDELREGLGAYGVVAQTSYNAFDASRSIGAGLRLHDRPHSVSLVMRGYFNRPAFFIRNELDTSNIFRLQGEYSYRFTPEIELKGLLDYYRQTYDMTKGLDNHTRFLGAAVRYRGFGYGFSPELGIRRGRQDTVADDNDYSQTELLVKVRSVASRTVYLSFRYRYRLRRYDTTLPGSRNFDRKDNRHAFRALATIRSGEHLLWEIYFARENADSL